MLCTVFLCSCATYPIEKSAHPIAIGVDYDSAGKYYTQIGLYCIFDGEQPTNNIKYDLYGRRVADNYKGIYIMNGKKYINR